MAKYALLDYDGFICKAFFAAAARGDMEDAPKVLKELTESAIDRACAYFQDDVEVIKVVSGHTYKKDLYPEYKAHRKKDPYVGLFRELTLNNDDSILKIDNLEADDVLVLLNQALHYQGHRTIVFSDDKDLRYYTICHCKININENVKYEDYRQQYLIQMLTGDKEDNIKGIPKVGQKTAEKLIDRNGDIETVAGIYKSKNLDLDEAIKQVILITPITYLLCPEAATTYSKTTVEKILEEDSNFLTKYIESQIMYISNKFRRVYGEDKTDS